MLLLLPLLLAAAAACLLLAGCLLLLLLTLLLLSAGGGRRSDDYYDLSLYNSPAISAEPIYEIALFSRLARQRSLGIAVFSSKNCAN
jgi:hypothetical protein